MDFSHVLFYWLIFFLSFFPFFPAGSLLLVLVRFAAFALTLELNTSFAGTRGAIPYEYSGAPIWDGEESY